MKQFKQIKACKQKEDRTKRTGVSTNPHWLIPGPDLLINPRAPRLMRLGELVAGLGQVLVEAQVPRRVDPGVSLAAN